METVCCQMEIFSNEAKQGGVLFPMLFAMYTDGFLKKMEISRVCFYMENKFMDGVSFADDLKLLTPIHKGLKKLIYIVSNCLQNLILNLIVQKANIWYIKVELVLYITKMFL